MRHFPNTLTACAMFSLGVSGGRRHDPTEPPGPVLPPQRASQSLVLGLANADAVVPSRRDIPFADAAWEFMIRPSSGYVFATGRE